MCTMLYFNFISNTVIAQGHLKNAFKKKSFQKIAPIAGIVGQKKIKSWMSQDKMECEALKI